MHPRFPAVVRLVGTLKPKGLWRKDTCQRNLDTLSIDDNSCPMPKDAIK